MFPQYASRWLRRLRVGLCLIALAYGLRAAPVVDILPPRSADPSLSLSGEWDFKYLPGENLGADDRFFSGSRAKDGWGKIKVPGHWELQGFAEPTYKKIAEGTGLYYRTFKVPSDWMDRRVLLRFEGVLYGFTVWVNGREVGEWDSSYNPSTFDVTDALRFDGSENTLALKVLTQSRQSEFDRNDCWTISGIYRDVMLISLPRLHLTDYGVRTSLKPDNSAAIAFTVAATGGERVRGVLKSPDGKTALDFEVALDSKGRGATQLLLPKPVLWTAETPFLYGLSLELLGGSSVLHRYEDRIGVREITVADSVLKLNGRPIKLRGINHHDIWPEQGRVATEALMRRDLDMIRDANINFIRTSHYPPHPRLIELCDEMGFYVMCEVPFGYGDNNLTDPTFAEPLVTRARATVNRDKNRPSVIAWSIGNENPLTDLGVATARWVKENDPTRVVCFPTVGSYFRDNEDKFEQLPPFIDVMSPHYADPGRIRELAARHKRPLIITEYAHALGLASDRIKECWETMRELPNVAGGALWLFQDQGILRRSEKPVNPFERTQYAWKDANTYYDTAKTDGADGIVYSDRTPQADYWQVQKVYSPVLVELKEVKPSGWSLIVVNRHDFRSLQGMHLTWKLQDGDKVLKSAEVPLSAASHDSETLEVPARIPDDPKGVYSLKVECRNEAGRVIVVRSFPLRDLNSPFFADLLLDSLGTGRNPSIARDGRLVEVRGVRGIARLDTQSGRFSLLDAKGNVIVSDLRPHFGRRLTMAEELRSSRRTKNSQMDLDLRDGSTAVWGPESAAIAPTKVLFADFSPAQDGARLILRADYERGEDKARSQIHGEISVLVRSDGSLNVDYKFQQDDAIGQIVEAGLAMLAPVSATELRWIGDGPFPGYPGKESLNEFGFFHLNRDDISFNGNRRRVGLLSLTDSNGTGVLLAGQAMDVALENDEKFIRISHNALVSSRGNKGSSPGRRLDMSAIRTVEGSFFVVPLAEARSWPALLERWLGSPNTKVTPFKPFYHSYDQ